jgi:asparagine synthase (glutamine-hydrolysing)
MCGIAGIAGSAWRPEQLAAMVEAQGHRGPDGRGLFVAPGGLAGLGHDRLSIIDLSEAGRQPMASPDGRYHLVLNGEIYNYRELRRELDEYPYVSQTDTEVLLAAYSRWGRGCLDRLVGMFAFALWDESEQVLYAARDRFGVKPFYYHVDRTGTLRFASEIKALHAGGVAAEEEPAAWATYLAFGLTDHSESTFWKGIRALPAGHAMTWSDGQVRISAWYDLAAAVGPECDGRTDEAVEEEYTNLLRESVALRFRSDVPVGVNLSGGLDSSLLLGLIHEVQGSDSDVKAFTFVTGDPAYDELPWVRRMLETTRHASVACPLSADEVPALSASVAACEDEPFGGLPTLAYARLFEVARAEGVTVLLDGQGLDEQWAGYDYYLAAEAGGVSPIVQGAASSPVRPHCLVPEFRALASPLSNETTFGDPVRDLQWRDLCVTKIPRALRYNDRASMRASTELREPFLDHRLVELALRQPAARKIRGGTGKWLPRRLARRLVPAEVRLSPKRPLQTPQREWLRGPLRPWATECVEAALDAHGGRWLEPEAVRAELDEYFAGRGDNSFFLWQWMSLAWIRRSEEVRIYG